MQAGLFVFDLETSTSIHSIPEVGKMEALPNPFSDYLDINVDLRNVSEVNISLVDLWGRVVAEQHFSALPSGEQQVGPDDERG